MTYDDLLSPTELAGWLTVPLSTIYNWRYTNSGPPGFKVGRHVRYRRCEVEAWLDKQRDLSKGR
jgi:excisionase family DNA binding protein